MKKLYKIFELQGIDINGEFKIVLSEYDGNFYSEAQATHECRKLLSEYADDIVLTIQPVFVSKNKLPKGFSKSGHLF